MGVKIREKEKGSCVWWVFISQNGKRTSKRVGTKKVAKELQTELESRIAKQDFEIETEKAPTLPTFKEYVERGTGVVVF